MVVLILAGFLVRVFMLGTKSFWFDESIVLLEAQNSIRELFGSRAEGIHPPLYRFIMHFWLYISTSEWVVRIPSMLFSICSIVFVYKIARLVFDKRTALVSGFIMCLSPFQVYYGQEVKMYSLFLMLSLASLYFYLRILRDNKNISWMGYLLTALLSLYTHYFAFITLAAQNLFLFAYSFMNPGKKIIRKWLIIQGLIFLLFTPWLSCFLVHVTRVREHFWVPPLSAHSVFGIFKNFVLGYYSANMSASFQVLFLFLFAAGIAHILRHRDLEDSPMGWGPAWKLFFVSCFFLAPLVVAVVFSSLVRPVYIDRTLIVVSAFYYLILAQGIVAFRRRRLLFWGIMLAIGVFFTLGLKNYYTGDHFSPSVGVVKKKPVRELIRFIASQYRAGDAIVLGHCSLVYPFRYYSSLWMKGQMYLAENSVRDANEDDTLYGMKVTFNVDIADIRKIGSTVKGIWLVCAGWGDTPVPLSNDLQRWLDKQQMVRRFDGFKGLLLYYYRIYPGSMEKEN